MDTSIELCRDVRKASRVFLIGNGGSAANAAHICNDLETCGIRAYVMNEATKSAWENDYEHADVFARWINLHGESEDLLIVLSGSGNSPNILEAIRAAKKKTMTTWAIIGAWKDGNGRLGKASRSAHHVIARGANMQSAEEWQLRIGHEVMRCLKAG